MSLSLSKFTYNFQCHHSFKSVKLLCLAHQATNRPPEVGLCGQGSGLPQNPGFLGPGGHGSQQQEGEPERIPSHPPAVLPSTTEAALLPWLVALPLLYAACPVSELSLLYTPRAAALAHSSGSSSRSSMGHAACIRIRAAACHYVPGRNQSCPQQNHPLPWAGCRPQGALWS